MSTLETKSTRPGLESSTTLAAGRNKALGRVGGKVFFYLFVAAFVFFCIAPFIWLFLTSIKPSTEIYERPPALWPRNPTLEAYGKVFERKEFVSAIINSALVASSATVISLLIGSSCAYAIARLRFPGKNLILSLILSISMFPGIAILSPLYQLIKNVDLINKWPALILPYVTFSMPLGIWALTAYFRDLPAELEDSAKIDGASPLQAFTKVIAPLAAPGLFTTAILVFIFAWNEFLFAKTFMTTSESYTVPVSIASFEGTSGTTNTPWDQITAASVVITLPLIVLVLVFQRRIIAGLTDGAVKG